MLTKITEITDFLKDNSEKIEEWLQSFKDIDYPIYSSIDIRKSSFKYSIVDTNIFPSGFNNISHKHLELAAVNFKKYIDQRFPNRRKIGIFTEEFTRNDNYWLSIKNIKSSLEKAGFVPYILTTNEVLKNTIWESYDIKLEYLKEDNGNAAIENGTAIDLVLLNNDLSIPPNNVLSAITTPIVPSLKNGWYLRSKYSNCVSLNQLWNKFGNHFGIDPWFFCPYIDQQTDICFKKGQGLSEISKKADVLIKKIQKKYDEYSIKQTPSIFIKPDNGTFGRGIISITSGEEILHLNKKSRHSIHKLKNGIKNTKIILQEGVPTEEKVSSFPAEDVIYSVNNQAIAKFSRYNVEKSNTDNLNSHGMSFTLSKDTCFIDDFFLKMANISIFIT